MRTWNCYILIGLLTSCDLMSMRLNIKHKINLNGRVIFNFPPSFKLDTILGIESKIEIMKSDSTRICVFNTNKDGSFLKAIQLKDSWNPFILRITPLQNKTFVVKSKIYDNVWVKCDDTILNEQQIYKRKNENYLLKINGLVERLTIERDK